jgi:hypothetical protein
MESETTKYEQCPIQLELRPTEINNFTQNNIRVYFSERKQSKNGIWNYKGFIDFHVNNLATLYINVRMFTLYLPAQLIYLNFDNISMFFSPMAIISRSSFLTCDSAHCYVLAIKKQGL